MAAIGIDVGKATLDVAVFGLAGVERYANTAAGIRRLLQRLDGLADVRIVLEATGGYEDAMLAACTAAGLWIARINPRQARNFALATGQLAKTDHLDARMLAEMANVFHARLRPHAPAAPWQAELKGWLRRRHQVTDAIQRTRQQLRRTPPAVRPLARRTLAALAREQASIDATLRRLLQEHATPALRSAKGLGPLFQASMLSLLPELGHLTRRQVAKLVGVAPLSRDSGQREGTRHIFGGRAEVRVALYMATLSAVRWEPAMQAHYPQLRARGKAAKVALVACMRKLLTIVNARRRDELRGAVGPAWEDNRSPIPDVRSRKPHASEVGSGSHLNGIQLDAKASCVSVDCSSR